MQKSRTPLTYSALAPIQSGPGISEEARKFCIVPSFLIQKKEGGARVHVCVCFYVCVNRETRPAVAFDIGRLGVVEV